MGEGLEALEWPNAEALNDCDNLRSRPETMLMLVVLICTCPVVDSRLRRKERKMHRAAPNWGFSCATVQRLSSKRSCLAATTCALLAEWKEKKQLGTALLELGRLQVRRRARSVAQYSSADTGDCAHQFFWEIEKALAGTNHDGDDKSQGITNYDGS